MSNSRSLTQELMWVGIGQILAAAASLFGVRLLTVILSPQEYGKLTLALTLVTLMNLLISGPLSGAFLRYYAPAQESGNLGGFLMEVRQMTLRMTGIILASGAVVVGGSLLLGQRHLTLLIGFSTVFALLTGYLNTYNALQNAARHRQVVAWHQAIGEWLRYFSAFVFLKLLSDSSTAAMLGYCIAAGLQTISQRYFFRRQMVSAGSAGEWTRPMLAYARPFILWGGFSWVQGASERWSLEWFVQTQEVGFYAVLYQLGYYPVSLLSSIFTQMVAPILFKQAGGASDAERTRQAQQLNFHLVWISCGVTVILVAAAALLHPLLFRWLVDSRYHQVSSLLPWMVLAGGLYMAGQAASLSLMTANQPEKLLLPKIGTSIVGVVLNLAGAYLGGIEGVVYAIVLFSLLHFLWMLLAALRPEAVNRL
ncbi:MAG: oligosaccharide flippase family protein [Anaerolineae bacterium]|nr:oligosaccharide flippase family protein [Anaerolineae bacterium]